MSDALVWVHGDRLSPLNEALVAYPDAPAIFVFDDVVLNGYAVSLNRIQFMYECLLEMPVRILRGDPVEALVDKVAREGASRIVTTWTPAPRFKAIVAQLEQRLPVDVLPPQAFLETAPPLDLERFSRFWRSVQSVPLPGLDEP
jgi:hypothetical protein